MWGFHIHEEVTVGNFQFPFQIINVMMLESLSNVTHNFKNASLSRKNISPFLEIFIHIKLTACKLPCTCQILY